MCEFGTWSMRSLVISLRFKQTSHRAQGREGTSGLDVPCTCSVMGRKRSGADKALPGDPLAAPLAVVPRNIVPPRVSVLQAMCAAAVPDETMEGRQGFEAMFNEGNSRRGVTDDPHARSLLKTGHFVTVNNEIAKRRRHKETVSQLASNKTKEESRDGDGMVALTKDNDLDQRRTWPKRPREPATEKEAGKEQSQHVGLGGDDRSGERKPGNGRLDKSKSGMRDALKLAKAPNDLRKAKETFKKKFLAYGTLLAKNAKRKKVRELLVATVGEEHFPATQEAILSVATALDEAQLQSGDQYLHEVKLMHVEAGFEWSSPLERQLYLCKRALKRHRGPEIRAKEVQIADLSQEAWDMKCLDKGAYTRPAWMYAMAVSWMLRACEATELRMGDLALDWETKTVALKIRKSKTDQAAKGTVRTLACCKRSECTKECPFSLAVRSLAEKPNGKATDFLFSMQGRGKRTRAHTSKCWAKYLDGGLTGHSARRSGAMFYTRQGMDVQDISFLGQWKSSAVFRYMEEALQERPMNARLKDMTEDEAKGSVINHTQSLERWTATLTESKARSPRTPTGKSSPPGSPDKVTEAKPNGILAPQTPAPAPGTPCPIRIPEDPEDLQLWATSQTRGKKKVTHVVTRAAWQTGLNEWSTACGWHFAQRAVKVTLSKIPPASAHRCIKCEKVRELREKVPGGAGLAQLMSNESDVMLQK